MSGRGSRLRKNTGKVLRDEDLTQPPLVRSDRASQLLDNDMNVDAPHLNSRIRNTSVLRVLGGGGGSRGGGVVGGGGRGGGGRGGDGGELRTNDTGLQRVGSSKHTYAPLSAKAALEASANVIQNLTRREDTDVDNEEGEDSEDTEDDEIENNERRPAPLSQSIVPETALQARQPSFAGIHGYMKNCNCIAWIKISSYRYPIRP